MTGFKRASRRQAAVIGLALLAGTTFLGCHAGPRLFSRKDRDSQSEKQDLADKGKFINRKKVRPESEYRRDEWDDEQVAKSESKPKSSAKPSDSIKKPSNDAANRAIVTRKPLNDDPAIAARSSKAATTPSKSAKPAEQPQFARRDTTNRPSTELLEDSLSDDGIWDSRPSAPSPTAKKSMTRPTTTKAMPFDEDPFKHAVVDSSSARRPNEKVATVNFDNGELDLGLDDEADEEAEERAEAQERAAQKAQAVKKSVASINAVAPSLQRRESSKASTTRQKFLDDDDESRMESLTIDVESPAAAAVADQPRMSPPAVKRTNDAATTVAGQRVIDRRQSVQKTVDEWKREMELDEPSEPQPKPVAPTPPATARSNSAPFSQGHLSPASLDEFSPPAKSQGAVLNGELIIDTNSLPTRFQRSSMSPTSNNGAAGRINSNSGANIEIVPGATQNRPRPAGQISLQSSSDVEDSPGLTTADYEQSVVETDLGGLPSLKLESESETGPRLAALEVKAIPVPAPPVMVELAPAIGAAEPVSGSRGWKRTLLVLSAMLSAVGIGFALRRRNQLAAAPIEKPKL